ncbi:hypothetical protein BJ742DRAFT_819206 [Cladochytrium replicatum]|nr:hypothetical protein BJ742DRAFT_819206 [Cladochytrium replicatum]
METPTRRILEGFHARFASQRQKLQTAKDVHWHRPPQRTTENPLLLPAFPTAQHPATQLPPVPEDSAAALYILDHESPTVYVRDRMDLMFAMQPTSATAQDPDEPTELYLDNTEDTMEGSRVFNKVLAALENIYSGYGDLLPRIGSSKAKPEIQTQSPIQDDTIRSSTGEVPSSEEFLQARNKLWEALLTGNLHAIKELDGHGAYLYQQGVHGENVFLKACLLMYKNEGPGGLDYYSTYARIIAYFLTNEKHCRALVNSEYEGREYRGETAMHFAIVHDDVDMLRKFYQYGADFEISRARGNFFSKFTALYYGQSLLNFAVCLGRSEIVKFLLDDVKVDPNSWDYFGNTALHMMSWWGLYDDSGEAQQVPDAPDNDTAHHDMVRNALSKRAKKDTDGASTEQSNQNLARAKLLPLWNDLVQHGAKTFMRNYDDFTPFLVAVQRRNVGMVMAIIESTRQQIWDYRRVAGYRYPLTDIDIPKEKVRADQRFSDLDPRNIKNKDRFFRKEKKFNTALEIAISNRDSAMVANIPLFRIVLEAKWTMYASNMFNWFMFCFAVYQVLFVLAQSLLPIGPTDQALAAERVNYFGSGIGLLRLVVESLLLLANIMTLLAEYRELALLDYNIFEYLDLRADGAHNISQLLNVALFFGVVGSRANWNPVAEINFLTALNLISWLPLFYFFQGFRVLGPLIAAISRMRFVILRFMVIFLVVYMGFAMAFWVQMSPAVRNDVSGPNSTLFSGTSAKLDVIRPSAVNFNNATSVYDYLVAAEGNTQTFLSHTLGLLTVQDEYDKDVLARKFSNWFPGTIAWSFGVLLQVAERFADLEGANSQTFAYILLLVFAFISSIIFINVLIAMLNSTYSEVINEAENIWRIQWASLVLAMDKKIPYRRRRDEWALGYFLPRTFTEKPNESARRPHLRSGSHLSRTGTRSMSHHERVSPMNTSNLSYNSMGGVVGNATYFSLQYQKSDWALLKVITHTPDVDYWGFVRGEENPTVWSRYWSVARVLYRFTMGLKVPAVDVGEKIRDLSENRWKAIEARLPASARIHRATVGRRGWGG